MTTPRHVEMQRPPLSSVAPGDVVWVPAFVSEAAGGSPFWLQIIEAGPVVDRRQDVHGVRISEYGMAESDETLRLALELDRVHRRLVWDAS